MSGRADRFEVVMQHAAIGMCLMAPDGAVTDVNNAMCALLGRDAATLRAVPWRELTHPDDLAADEAALGALLHGDRNHYRLRKRYLHADGSVVHGDLSVTCVRHPDGSPAYFIGQVIDVTAEELLARRYRYLAENVNDVVVEGDNDGIISWTSPSITAVMGWGADELVGTSIRDLVHPDDPGQLAPVQRLLGEGKPGRLEVRVRRHDDTYRWMSIRVRPLFDDHGNVAGRLAGWWDSQEQHEAAEALARSEERYRLLAEHANDVVLRTGPDRTIDTVVGSTALLGRDAASLVGQPVLGLFAAADLADEGERLERLRRGESVTSRARVRLPDGTERWVDRRSAAVFDDDGRLQWYVSALTDAAADEEQRRRLRESERESRLLAERYEQARNDAMLANSAKTTFLSRMSHELRTPLNAILGFAQLLELDELTADQRDAVRQIRQGGKHLLDLVTEVLDISRIESGSFAVSLEPVSIADAVGEALDLVGPLVREMGVTVSGSGTLAGAVWADRQRVIQILINLLSNAVKYNRRGGTVAIGASEGADVVTVTVTDSGNGLTAAQMRRLFEPFDRLGAERTTVEGTGIGLTLSQSLARVMAGRIEVTSEVGTGSVFSLVLPRSRAESPAERTLGADHPAGTGLPIDVLYIEDNPTNQALMQRIVGLRPNARLRVAGDGTSGLRDAEAAVPDLVLLDLHLPDMQGDQVLALLRTMPAFDEVPIVVVTADATPGLGRRLTARGATAVITKPVRIDEVLAWLDAPRKGTR